MVFQVGIVVIEVCHCLLGIFLVILNELWHYVLHVTSNDIIGYGIDGGCRVIVDGNDD